MSFHRRFKAITNERRKHLKWRKNKMEFQLERKKKAEKLEWNSLSIESICRREMENK